MAPVSVVVRYHRLDQAARWWEPGEPEGVMPLEEIFDIAKRKRFLVVSTVNESGAPEAALMGFALTQAKEVVFDTLSTSRKAVNLARNPAAALVIGWDENVSLQIEGVARRPVGEDLASAKAAYFGEG